jgi:hypothetical protein
MERARLTPAQERVVHDLMALGQPRPSFRAELADELRGVVDEGVSASSISTVVHVNKSRLADYEACESYALAREDAFTWSTASARGSVAHKAVEYSVTFGAEAPPLTLVDEALAALRDDRDGGLATWLRCASPRELADLRGRAGDAVTKFLECWPPLERAWRPRAESSIKAEACGGLVVLHAKVDLALGQAHGQEARMLLVDLKTGDPSPRHRDDLRFYALVQTLRIGVPPFRVASYYLDSATFEAEDVSEELLHGAAQRVVAGVRRMVELAAARRPPAVIEGPQCGWCPNAPDCEGPERWQARAGALAIPLSP